MLLGASSPSPRLRGEGWGEGQQPTLSKILPLTLTLSPYRIVGMGRGDYPNAKSSSVMPEKNVSAPGRFLKPLPDFFRP